MGSQRWRGPGSTPGMPSQPHLSSGTLELADNRSTGRLASTLETYGDRQQDQPPRFTNSGADPRVVAFDSVTRMTDPDSYTTPPVVQAILDGLDFAEVRRIASLPNKQAELAVRIHRGKEMTPTPMVLPSASGPKIIMLNDEARSHSASSTPPVGDPPPRRRPSKPSWYPPIVPPTATGLLATKLDFQ